VQPGSYAPRLAPSAADLLDDVEFSPAALRADLAGEHVSARLVESASEMIDHAPDLLGDFASLVHDNERWRVFRARVQQLVTAGEQSAGAGHL
jgi:hypothetical protein